MTIGLVVVILLTWLLLKYVAKEPLSILGVRPTKQRLVEFTVAFLFMATIGFINHLWQAHWKEISYALNPDHGVLDFFGGTFWVFKAVLFEELLFRGVLLYLLIKIIGPIKACLVSSLIFGMYHWFSYDVFGARAILMVYVLLITGAGGWMFAYAYAKTKSLYAPTGLHMGWNMVTAVVFSSGPLGQQLLLQQGKAIQTGDWYTLTFFSLQTIIAPGIVTIYLSRRYRSS